METNELIKGGLEISAIMLGCIGMSVTKAEMPTDEDKETNTASAKIHFVGTWYPEPLMRTVRR